jgi:hypothetical protein
VAVLTHCHVAPAARVAGTPENRPLPVLLVDVHRFAALGTEGSLFGRGPFKARAELSSAHEADVSLSRRMTPAVPVDSVRPALWAADFIPLIRPVHIFQPIMPAGL